MSPALPGTLQTLFAYRLKLVAKELTTSMVILSYSLGTAWAKIPLASHTVAPPKGHIWQRPTRAHPDPANAMTGKCFLLPNILISADSFKQCVLATLCSLRAGPGPLCRAICLGKSHYQVDDGKVAGKHPKPSSCPIGFLAHVLGNF